MASRESVTRRYACLYTGDLKKKTKKWHDGYLQLHYFNRKLILLDSEFNHVDEVFWKKNRTPLLNAQSNALDPSFTLEDGDEVGLTYHIATVEGTVIHEARKDLSNVIQPAHTRKREVSEYDEFVRSEIQARNSIEGGAVTWPSTSARNSSNRPSTPIRRDASPSNIQYPTTSSDRSAYRDQAVDQSNTRYTNTVVGARHGIQ